jgi:hypothetical protein
VAIQPAVYEIKVKGRLEGDIWSRWFDGMRVTPGEKGETVLTGLVVDQAALYGLLARLRDLALPLLSLNLVEREDQGHQHSGKDKTCDDCFDASPPEDDGS